MPLALDQLLAQCAALHHHLCPRQVLGVRMGMLAGQVLSLELPQSDKRLLTIMETDGCGADGVAVATNCWVGRRTMRIEDYGKMAATFVDTVSTRAVRITPILEARHLSLNYAPEAKDQWQAQLIGYQRIADEMLLSVQEVTLKIPLEKIISAAGKRVHCELCGEEIMNEREVRSGGKFLCKACVGEAYYTTNEQ
ncbi:MAG: TraR/DksA C4-type zinc finger protein [Chloroflexi bacterium]|nr:TraR/DksA C4-type zinc finger protein [Chloroflexota bacterium]